MYCEFKKKKNWVIQYKIEVYLVTLTNTCRYTLNVSKKKLVCICICTFIFEERNFPTFVPDYTAETDQFKKAQQVRST